MTSICIELYRWPKLPQKHYSQYCFTAIQLPSGKNQVREHETNIYSERVLSTRSSDEVYSPMSRRHNTILYVRNTKPKLTSQQYSAGAHQTPSNLNWTQPDPDLLLYDATVNPDQHSQPSWSSRRAIEHRGLLKREGTRWWWGETVARLLVVFG